MKKRCLNPSRPNYKYYGARGIRVCDRWLHSFEKFFEDMGPRPAPGYSIERRDNDGDYTPENCYWATWSQQARNTRRSRVITFNGETKILSEWADATGIPANTLCKRLSRGWSVERTLTTPVNPKNNRYAEVK
jgi:hypothetical protein